MEEQIKNGQISVENAQRMIDIYWRNFSVSNIKNLLFWYGRRRYWNNYIKGLKSGDIPF